MFFDERFQDGGDFLLLASRQPRSGFKQLPHLSGRTGSPALGSVFAQEIFRADAQDFRQLQELIRAQSDRVTFPVGVGPLSESDLFSQLFLRQARRFAQRVQPFSERRPRLLGWSSCLHAVTIRHEIFC